MNWSVAVGRPSWMRGEELGFVPVLGHAARRGLWCGASKGKLARGGGRPATRDATAVKGRRRAAARLRRGRAGVTCDGQRGIGE